MKSQPRYVGRFLQVLDSSPSDEPTKIWRLFFFYLCCGVKAVAGGGERVRRGGAPGAEYGRGDEAGGGDVRQPGELLAEGQRRNAQIGGSAGQPQEAAAKRAARSHQEGENSSREGRHW